MRLSEILQEERVETCPGCRGDKTVVVGDSQLVFDCPDCKGRGYFGPEHGMRNDLDDVEELEEIKVTKTLAGKRKKPTETLAGKKNKEKKNAGKPAVSLKTRDAHELANIQLKGEYTS